LGVHIEQHYRATAAGNCGYDKMLPDRRHAESGCLAETEIGDWTMPDFKAASTYAASQGWLVVDNDALTLTTAGLRAA
jgi:hypothetical protein